MRRDERLNLRGKLCGHAIVVFISVEVMPVVTFEVGKRDFYLITGSHHPDRILVVTVDAAMAPLSIRGSRTIPKALTKRTALFSLQQPVCVKFAARAQYARHCLVYWDSDGIQNVVLFLSTRQQNLHYYSICGII